MLDGWIAINKPVGISSAQTVGRVRRALFKHTGEKIKIGHAGTLDPMASGVLPIALGEATKTIQYVMMTQKTYQFSVQWGAETVTDDREGAISKRTTTIPTKQQIEKILPEFIGESEQIPPDYSAVKIAGKRAYALARARDYCYDQGDDRGRVSSHEKETHERGGHEKEGFKRDAHEKVTHEKEGHAREALLLTPRVICIDRLDLLQAETDRAHFNIECGKGTYIRALARDLGRKLGSAAHIIALERQKVGKFCIENTISLDLWEKEGYSATAYDHILPIKTVLQDLSMLQLSTEEADKLRQGQAITLNIKQRIKNPSPSEVILSMKGINPVALVKYGNGKITPIRVFRHT